MRRLAAPAAGGRPVVVTGFTSSAYGAVAPGNGCTPSPGPPVDAATSRRLPGTGYSRTGFGYSSVGDTVCCPVALFWSGLYLLQTQFWARLKSKRKYVEGDGHFKRVII
ncbi:hypothetical protein BaRGS_00034817 [Batillaria attramentaria]|uniref:Uncharacterized protein n=1 Tax=Batillaria attramentaria TaxID=370345 RepID=A0ABD0JHN2_9CAEN